MDILIVVHLILSTILIAMFYNRNRLLMYTMGYSLIILLFPIGGMIVLYVLNSTTSKEPSLESKHGYLNYSFDEGKKFRYIQELNEAEESSVIPIQKALRSEDYIRRRETVLNLIKKDINNYSTFMNMALANDDGETSHYAASSILNSKRKLDNNINNISELYNKDINNPRVLVAYADQLMEVINNGFLDYEIKINYIKENIIILKRIVNEKIDIDSRHLFNLIDLLLVTEDFENVYIYCDLLLNVYPKTETKYMLILKSYYTMKDIDKFNITLEKFLASDISFSKDTINIVRFWLGG